MIDVASRYVQLLTHEINNPLTVLYGQASLLRALLDAAPVDPTKVATSLATIEANTARVIDLVRELREAFRDVASEPAELVRLADLLGAAEPFVDRAFRTRGGSLEQADVPAEVLVCVGPVRTRAVIWRLIARALELGDGRVRTDWEVDEAETRVRIRATGHPVDVADLDLVAYAATLDGYGAGLRATDGGLEIYFPRVD